MARVLTHLGFSIPCLERLLPGTPNVLEVRIDWLHVEDDLPEGLQDSDGESVLEIEFSGSHSI